MSCQKTANEYEYYRRGRCYDEGLALCDFESPYPSHLCHLSDDRSDGRDTKVKDVWKIVNARGRQPSVDHTLSTSAGHYLYLLETDKRPKYAARVQTPFFNSTGKCLTFYYHAVGSWKSSAGPTFRVYVRKENLKEIVMKKEIVAKGGLEYIDSNNRMLIWNRMHVPLPPGLHQVILEGERSSRDSSGLLVDDLSVHNCAESETTCVRTRLGLDYRGTINTTITGRPCMAWGDAFKQMDSCIGIPYELCPFAKMAYKNDDNYCRAIPSLSNFTAKISCFVDKETLEECQEQKYCACEHDQVTCGSKFCLPNSLVCNGEDDCGDSLDETAACEHMTSMTCDFEEEFMCGYKRETATLAGWERLRGPGPNQGTSPTSDRKGTSIGYYMIVTSGQTEPGVQVTLISPRYVITSPRQLTFDVFMNLPKDDAILRVYRQDWQGFNDQLLLEVKGDQGDRWQGKNICLPKGSYSLAFQATMGEIFRSDVAIDDVHVTERMCTPDEVEIHEDVGINCNFEKGSLCGYQTQSTALNLYWTYIEKDHVDKALKRAPTRQMCNMDIFTLHGKIELEGYPQYFNNMKCTQTIHQANGSVLILSFEDFSLENAHSCSYDSLKIWDGDPLVSKGTFCGDKKPNDLSLSQTPVTLFFKSDYSVRRDGYSLEYTASLMNTTEYSLTLVYQGEPDDGDSLRSTSGRVDTAKLISPYFYLNSTGCLRAKVYTPGNLRVDMWYETDVSVENVVVFDIPLTDPPLPNPFFWADVVTDLRPVNEQTTEYRLVFTTTVTSYMAYYPLILDAFVMDYEPCSTRIAQEVDLEELECDFGETGEMCNYVDSSQSSQSLWVLATTEKDLGVSTTVRAILRVGRNDFASLLSPVTTVHSNTSCLCAHINLPSENIPVYRYTRIHISFGMVDTNGFRTLLKDIWVDGAISACTLLPIGTYRVEILALDDISMYEDTVVDIKKISFENNSRCHPDDMPYYDDYNMGGIDGGWLSTLGSDSSGSGSGLGSGSESGSGSETEFASGSGSYSGSESGFGSGSGSGFGSGSGSGFGSGSGSGFGSGSGSGFGSGSDSESDSADEEMLEYTYDYGYWSTNEEEIVMTDVLGFEDPVLERIGGTNMAELIDELGHQYEDIIFSCYWQGANCPEGTFTESLTDYGLCQTFNGNASQPMSTDQAGGDSGIQLLLNIEQYEYVKIRSVDAGVKVHLHTQDGVADVKNLGFAAPVGMHSLAPVTYTISRSLPHPYGNCTEKRTLPLFEGHEYTRLKCKMECLTNHTVQKCLCRDIYMPGPSPVCDLDSELRCLTALRDFSQGEGHVHCNDCDDECDASRNAVSLSYAQLSGLSVNELLNTQREKIAAKYHKALEIKHRVEGDLLLNTVDQLLDIEAKYSKFRNYLEFSVLDSLTSITQRLELLAYEMREKIIIDSNRMFTMLQARENQYNSFIKPHVLSVQTVLQDFSNKASQLGPVLMSWKVAGKYSKELAQTLLDNTLVSARNTHEVLTLFLLLNNLTNEVGGDWPFGLPDYLQSHETSVDDCALLEDSLLVDPGELQQLVETIEKIQLDFSVPSSSPRYSSTFDDLDAPLREARSKALKLSDCYSEYEDLLHTIRSWMSTLPSTSEAMVRYDSSEIIDRLEVGERYLHQLQVNYTENHITKLDLASALGSSTMTAVIQDIARIYEDINGNIISTIQSALTDRSKETTEAYLQGLTYAGILNNHFKNDWVESNAREISLWRKPTPSIDSPELIRYLITEKEYPDTLEHLWPQGRSIDSFLNTSGTALIQQTVRDFYQGMSAELTEMKLEVKNMQSEVSSAISKFHSSLEMYNTTSEISEPFIMNNFLKLDIFYGELKYELIEQKKGYTMATYFGDMGGYMGLLLGGSVITIFELLDLFIYNMVKKCRYRKGKLTKVEPMN